MAQAFTGEIAIFGAFFTPRLWSSCAGQLVSTEQYSHLFLLIGTHYGSVPGGFNLPDLKGRVPIGQGTGPGLSARPQAYPGGLEEVALAENQMPTHSHTAVTRFTNEKTKITNAPAGQYLSRSVDGTVSRLFDNAPINSQQISMSGDAISSTGSGETHQNMQPYVVFNYSICIGGAHPLPS